jgi:CO/xanthine dehydrogenase FAD-binding subunit
MKSFVPAYELATPPTLSAALELLAREPGAWRPIAGGTDLMVLFEAGALPFRRLLNLWHLRELRGIEETPEHITLGARTTYTEVQAHATLRREFPLLCQAAAVTGGVATQNRGTLGGNIVNASPAADSPPALLVYDAELELVSAAGSRWVPYRSFHTGYKQMNLRPHELLQRIRLPRTKAGWRHYYRKVGTRKAQAISKVVMAAAALLGGTGTPAGAIIGDIRISLGSVAPTVLRCEKTEALLRGQKIDADLIRAARESLAGEIRPIDDIRSTAAYRTRVAQNLLEEFLLRISGPM